MDNTTSTSISVQWANLTSLINRKVLHYIISLNETNVNTLAYEVTDGSRLSTEIDGLKHRTNYEVTVFGVDELGVPYKTLEVNATTKNSKKVYCTSKSKFKVKVIFLICMPFLCVDCTLNCTLNST